MRHFGSHPWAGKHQNEAIRNGPLQSVGEGVRLAPAEASGDHPVNSGNVPSSATRGVQTRRLWGGQRGVCVLEPREWEKPRAWLERNQVQLRPRQGEIRPALPQLCKGIRRAAMGKSRQEQRASSGFSSTATWGTVSAHPPCPHLAQWWSPQLRRS